MAPPPKPPPAAPAKAPARDLFDWLVGTVVIVVFGVGAFTLAWPWVRGADPWARDVSGPPVPPGVVCLSVTKESARGTSQRRYCDLDDGWHAERRSDGTVMAIPDDLRPLRRPWRYEAAEGR